MSMRLSLIFSLVIIQTFSLYAWSSHSSLWEMPSGIDSLNISERLALSDGEELCKKRLRNKSREIHLFSYPSGKYKLKAYISFEPAKKSQAPVLFFLRGGNNNFGLMNPANSISCYGSYTVIGLSYRGGVSPGKDEYGGKDLLDVAALINFFPHLASTYGISTTSNRYMLGASRGGLQMFLVLNKFPAIQQQFKSVLSLSGILDLELLIKQRPSMNNMFRRDFGLSDRNAKQWIRARNPIKNLHNISRDLPIIILQASHDQRVTPLIGKKMVIELISKGFRNIRYREITHAQHALRGFKNDMHIIWQLFGEEK